MANLADFGKFRLIVWRTAENPSETDYPMFNSDAAQAKEESPWEILGGFWQTWKIIRQETIEPFFEETL